MMENSEEWLPIVFISLMALSFLLYAILDGYDLGVGILLPLNNEPQRDLMIASIGPFWDANETWLVLAVGLLLVAFPAAHSIILTELYLPVLLLLTGLILRGVAFDFRAKAAISYRHHWDKAFKFGSLLAAMSQGFMIGQYVMGFSDSWPAFGFSILSAICVAAGYSFIGAAWLVMKTENELQLKAASWARRAGWLAALGLASVSLVNVMISDVIAEKWLSMPQAIMLLPIPIICLALFVITDRYLNKFPYEKDFGVKIPFFCALAVFFFSFQGLAYSFYPYIVPGQMTIYEAAADVESLKVLFIGAIFVMPTIIGYTFFAYRVFSGKVTQLKYY